MAAQALGEFWDSTIPSHPLLYRYLSNTTLGCANLERISWSRCIDDLAREVCFVWRFPARPHFIRSQILKHMFLIFGTFFWVPFGVLPADCISFLIAAILMLLYLWYRPLPWKCFPFIYLLEETTRTLHCLRYRACSLRCHLWWLIVFLLGGAGLASWVAWPLIPRRIPVF